MGEQLLALAQQLQDPRSCSGGPSGAGEYLVLAGEFGAAQAHWSRALALYDPQQHRRHACSMGMTLASSASLWRRALWLLGLSGPGPAAE